MTNAFAPVTVGQTPAVDKLDTVEHDSTEVVVRLAGVYGASELGCGFRFGTFWRVLWGSVVAKKFETDFQTSKNHVFQ